MSASPKPAASTDTIADAPPAAAEEKGYVGARIGRVEDRRFLTGNARYVDNVDIPGALHAAFVRSPYAHARILSIDASAARGAPHVHAVYIAADLADELDLLVTEGQQEGVAFLRRTALATDKVCHVGDPVAVVVAESRYAAEDSCDLVVVDYEPLPAVTDVEAAQRPDAPVINDDLGQNLYAHLEDEAGDVDSAFANASRVFSKRFQHGRSTAAPLECRAVVAHYDRVTERMTIWCSSQIPHGLRTFLAPILKMPENRLTVIAPDVGGGFGLKLHVFPEDAVIPAAARLLGRPVKWIEDRFENLAAGVHSKEMLCELELATTQDGTFLAMRGRFVSDSGAYGGVMTNALTDMINAATGISSLYDIPSLAYTAEAVLTNKCATGAVRGVGWSPGQTARETLLEEAARALGIDPLELRLKNCIGPEPRQMPFGHRYDGGSYAAALMLVAERIGYDAFRERQRAERVAGRYLGVGFSAYIEPGGLGCAGSVVNRLPALLSDFASVTVEPDGTVTVSTGLHSHGQGHETTLAQVAADELGVTIDAIRIEYGNTDSSVYGAGTFASRSAVVGSGSIMLAAREVARRLAVLAAQLLAADVQEIALRRGFAFVRSDPRRSLPIAAVARFAYFGGPTRPAEVQERGLCETRGYDPLETYGNGAIAAIVEVDPDTGFVTVAQLAVVEDCGVMLNPMIVDGQLAGGIAQGVGVALLEDAAYGDDGEFLAGSLIDYLYPSTTEVPRLDIAHLQTPSQASMNGVKGMGESGTIAAPGAIVNAIADALWPFRVRVDRTPITPAYLLGLIREAGRRPVETRAL